MAGEDHRLSLRALLEDEIADLLPTDGVEAAHRLIEDDELRIVQERLRQADALGHALAEAPDRSIDGVGQAHLRDHLVGAPLARLLVHPAEASAQIEELVRLQVLVHVGVLGQVPEATHLVGSGALFSEEANAPRGGKDEAEDRLDRGGLAGPVGAEDPEDLPLLHREIHAAHRLDLLPEEAEHEGLGEALHLEHGLGLAARRGLGIEERPLFWALLALGLALGLAHGLRSLTGAGPD